MAAVTICSDFGAPQNKLCHCFHARIHQNIIKKYITQLLNQVHLLDVQQAKTETPRFAERVYKAAEQGDGKANLRSSFLKVRGLNYLWDTEAGGLRHGVRPLESEKR